MMKKTSMILSLIVLLASFVAHSQTLNTGPWRFELKTTYGKIPFIIHFKKNKKGFIGTLQNGKETIQLNDISIDQNKISIPLQMYEMSLEMNLPNKGMMDGALVRHNKNPKVETPVIAVHGVRERFPGKKNPPTIDLTGRWAITLTDDQDKAESGILVFEQTGHTLHGSILTTTGDYRYIEGYVSGSDFEAASFDGVYNYLVKGNVKNGKLEASILSSYKTKIEGKKDQRAALPDAYKQTQVAAMNFKFPDLKGKMVSLSDEKFKNKPVIVQFFGSWCPNCIDEMNYLIPWYKENQKRGVEIIALAFERSLDQNEAKRQLLKVQKKKALPYPLLIAGSTSQDKPADKIPGLKNFISFPTTVFLNRKHEVVKVHAGFTGPSTGEFYENWKTEFNHTVDELLK